MVYLITDAELLALGIASISLASVSEGDRDQARASASSVVLSYLQKRYGLPLVSWSVDVKRAVATVAAFDLLARRGYNPTAGVDVMVQQRYDYAVQWLRDVARGIVEPESVVDSTPAEHEATPLIATGEAEWAGRRWR